MDKHCSSGKSPFVWKSLDILPRCSWTRCCCLLWYALAMQIRASCHRALSCLVVRNCRWGGERRNLALSIWNTIKNIMWGTFSGWLQAHTKKISQAIVVQICYYVNSEWNDPQGCIYYSGYWPLVYIGLSFMFRELSDPGEKKQVLKNYCSLFGMREHHTIHVRTKTAYENTRQYLWICSE